MADSNSNSQYVKTPGFHKGGWISACECVTQSHTTTVSWRYHPASPQCPPSSCLMPSPLPGPQGCPDSLPQLTSHQAPVSAHLVLLIQSSRWVPQHTQCPHFTSDTTRVQEVTIQHPTARGLGLGHSRPKCPLCSALEYFISRQHSEELIGKRSKPTQPPPPRLGKCKNEGQIKRQKNMRPVREKLMGCWCIISVEETRKRKRGLHVISLGAKNGINYSLFPTSCIPQNFYGK